MFLGLDFGTLSVRGVAFDVSSKRIVATHTEDYSKFVAELDDGGCLFTDPDAWVLRGEQVLERLCVDLKKKRGEATVDGVGVAFTSCTVVPLDGKGRPLCMSFRGEPRGRPHVHAKMWKHHSPKAQICADELTAAVGTPEINNRL
jgi:L-ribulokinase